MAYDFDRVAPRYDRMNCLMTFGMDQLWRMRAAKECSSSPSARFARPTASGPPSFHSPCAVLDVACGTGDMTIALAKRGCTVTGIDLSGEMLAIAQQKTSLANLQSPNLIFQPADAEALPFDDDSFDCVTCAFGVRNFIHLEDGLSEMLRVLKPGGRLAILELATPDNPLVRPIYNCYTRHLIPWLGQWLAGSRAAYTYLPQSIVRFPKGEAFLRHLRAMGFANVGERKMTFGVCRLYMATKQ